MEGPGGGLRFVIHSDAAHPVRIATLGHRLAGWSAAPPTPAHSVPPAGAPLLLPGILPEVRNAVPARPRRRSRRTATLVAGIDLAASGVGLAVALSHPGGRVTSPPAPRPTADQRLAQSVLLTLGDLPAGWGPTPAGGSAGESPVVQHEQGGSPPPSPGAGA